MGRKKKRYVEDHIFRIYPDYPLLVLDKIAWAKAGANDPLHFHYYLEIGYCYEGQGTIISEGEEAETRTVRCSLGLHDTASYCVNWSSDESSRSKAMMSVP